MAPQERLQASYNLPMVCWVHQASCPAAPEHEIKDSNKSKNSEHKIEMNRIESNRMEMLELKRIEISFNMSSLN